MHVSWLEQIWCHNHTLKYICLSKRLFENLTGGKSEPTRSMVYKGHLIRATFEAICFLVKN